MIFPSRCLASNFPSKCTVVDREDFLGTEAENDFSVTESWGKTSLIILSIFSYGNIQYRMDILTYLTTRAFKKCRVSRNISIDTTMLTTILLYFVFSRPTLHSFSCKVLIDIVDS